MPRKPDASEKHARVFPPVPKDSKIASFWAKHSLVLVRGMLSQIDLPEATEAIYHISEALELIRDIPAESSNDRTPPPIY